jgi:hypothetical protein
LNLVDFILSTCSTLSTLVSPLIELSSKHQNSQESFQLALRRRQTSGTRDRPTAGAAGRRVPGSLAWMVPAPPPMLPPVVWLWRGCPSIVRATVAPCAGPPHPRLLPRWRPHRGRYKTSYAAGAASAFLDGLVLTPAVRTRARTSSRALGRPPFAGTALVRRWPLSSVLRWSPPVVRLPTAEVVASTGETVSATCHRASDSLALMASLLPPIGRRGEDLFAVAYVLRWSPLLASRRCRGGRRRWC